MTIWHMRFAFWTPKATNTHSEYVTLIAFPLQQRLHNPTTMLRYTYIAYLVSGGAYLVTCFSLLLRHRSACLLL
jgi:hypothetical protein